MSPLRPRRLRLRSRFMIFILTGVGLISALMAGISFFKSREALLEARQEQLFELVSSQAAELGRGLGRVSQVAEDLAATLEEIKPTNADSLRALIQRHLTNSKDIYGMAVAYSPYAFDPKRKLFAPYLHRTPKGVKAMDLSEGGYDYPRQDWFLCPAILGRPVWSQPYFDEGGGNILMSTYSVPMVVNGKVLGVVTCDEALDRLGREVSRMAVGQKGYAFLITKMGTFLAAPVKEWVMRESIFSLAEKMNSRKLRLLGKRMIKGTRGVVRIRDWRTGKYAWLAFTPVKGVGWSFGAMMPESEVLAPVWQLSKWQAYLAGAGVVALILVVWPLVMGLTRPLRRLAKGAQRLASGDLSTKVEDVRPGDEVGDLASAFNLMVDDLNRYVSELTETTAAKERIESELDLARQIQESILPRTYPAFPDRPEFDLFARTTPAREVGGDFYDFFFVDDTHLGMVVGDVSGKGVPAALFMTVSRTLIKNSALHQFDPVEVLNEVNAQIMPDNEMCMFVTVFYAVYDLETGRLNFANAGHPPPLLRRASGEVAQLPATGGTVLGVLPDMGITPGEVFLQKDDVLLIFTDGLDEAINQYKKMFTIERARQWLAEANIAEAPDMLDNLTKFHQDFTGDVEQFDDLTLLLFRIRA